jgi:hypothetical protein
MAGLMILASLGLAVWVSQWWLLLALFVGLNLFQWGLTGFCPAEFIFAKLGLPEAPCAAPRNAAGK